MKILPRFQEGSKERPALFFSNMNFKDGAATSSEDRILLVAATNRPQEIDEAARRRFVKRLYVPLPDAVARSNIISVLLKDQNQALSEQEIIELGLKIEGISLHT